MRAASDYAQTGQGRFSDFGSPYGGNGYMPSAAMTSAQTPSVSAPSGFAALPSDPSMGRTAAGANRNAAVFTTPMLDWNAGIGPGAGSPQSQVNSIFAAPSVTPQSQKPVDQGMITGTFGPETPKAPVVDHASGFAAMAPPPTPSAPAPNKAVSLRQSMGLSAPSDRGRARY